MHLENIDVEENSHPHEHSDAYTMSSVTTKKMIHSFSPVDYLVPTRGSKCFSHRDVPKNFIIFKENDVRTSRTRHF